ncbi:MAG: hypothetical protein AB7U79_08880 [Candidatus Izemoplasmatales bacterium]
MAKRCPNCKSEISRYQEFCYQCGQEIKRTSKRPKHEWRIHWGYFFIGLIVPPLGYLLFFVLMSSRSEESRSAIIGALTSSVLWFAWARISYLIWPEDVDMSEMILWFIK